MVVNKQTSFHTGPCPKDYYAKLRTPGCRMDQKTFEPHNKPKPTPGPIPPTPPGPVPNTSTSENSTLFGGSILGGGTGILLKNALKGGIGEYSAVATEETGLEMAEFGTDEIIYQSGTVGESALLDEPIIESVGESIFGEIELADLGSYAASSGSDLALTSGSEALTIASMAEISTEAGILGSEAVTANMAVQIGIAETEALPLDLETFGLSSLAAIGIGSGIGIGMTAGILALTKDNYMKNNPRKSSSKKMTTDQINASIQTLEKSTKESDQRVLNMLKDNKKNGRDVYNIFDGKRSLVIGRANNDTLGLYASQYQKDYTKFKGIHPKVLEAIGLNPLLSKGVGIRAQDSYFSGISNLPTADQIIGKPIAGPIQKTVKPLTNPAVPVNKPSDELAKSS